MLKIKKESHYISLNQPTTNMHISTTPQDFLDQSLLLIQARPVTTRITTTYSTPSRRQLARLRKKQKPRSAPPSDTSATAAAISAKDTISLQATGKLTLKTYDPVSGACIKFITNKVSDVGRLVGVLGKAARGMSSLLQQKESKEDNIVSDMPLTRVDSPAHPSLQPLRVKSPSPAPAAQLQQQQGGPSAGGKGRKKGGRK